LASEKHEYPRRTDVFPRGFLPLNSFLAISHFGEILSAMPSPTSSRRVPRREAAIFKALGHPARLQIVLALARQETCVCDLVALTGLGWSTVSRHLSVLRAVGVVADDKRGQQIFYSLRLPCVARFVACLQSAAPGQDAAFSLTPSAAAGGG
jgi:DNA-binding transcriptional ArsR family regulator